MYPVIAFLAWSMLGLCSLIFLAEIADMITAARRRRLTDPAAPGAFNLRPHESNLAQRHDHKTRTGGGRMSGLNQFD